MKYIGLLVYRGRRLTFLGIWTPFVSCLYRLSLHIRQWFPHLVFIVVKNTISRATINVCKAQTHCPHEFLNSAWLLDNMGLRCLGRKSWKSLTSLMRWQHWIYWSSFEIVESRQELSTCKSWNHRKLALGIAHVKNIQLHWGGWV